MSAWQWFNEISNEAKPRGNDVPGRLLQLHEHGFQCRQTDPDRTLAVFREAQQAALGYGHPWWIMLFDQWLVHGMIYYKCDYRSILESAVRNVLTVSKPTYAGYHNVFR